MLPQAGRRSVVSFSNRDSNSLRSEGSQMVFIRLLCAETPGNRFHYGRSREALTEPSTSASGLDLAAQFDSLFAGAGANDSGVSALERLPPVLSPFPAATATAALEAARPKERREVRHMVPNTTIALTAGGSRGFQESGVRIRE